MNIAQVLHDHASTFGDRLAIADGRESLTFAGLDAASARAAAELADAGLQPDDRALVLGPMSTALYVALIGMFRLGVVAVFVDPSAGMRHVAECCARLRPRAFAGTARAHLLRLIAPSIRRIPIKMALDRRLPRTRTVGITRDRLAAVDSARIQPREENTPALVTFTSGSTGVAKAAVRTHGFLLAQHRTLAAELELRDGDVDLATLPMFVLANLASGITSVIPDADLRGPARVDPSRLLDRIRSFGCNRIAASPAVLERLAAYLVQSGQQLEVERIFTGGAPVFPRLLDALASVAPRASVAAVYGSTEAEPIARLHFADMSETDRAATRSGRGLLAGRPAASIRIRIIADRWGTPLGPYTEQEFDAAALPHERAGEIVVSGAHVLDGYLGGIGDGETKIRVGDRVWHRTGDAGYIDVDGRLWLLGRCSARLADHDDITYPFVVEAAASEVSGVRRSAYVLHRGRRTLVVEWSGGPGAVAGILKRHLHWALLDDVLVVDQVPVDKRHNAKVDYPALEALLGRV